MTEMVSVKIQVAAVVLISIFLLLGPPQKPLFIPARIVRLPAEAYPALPAEIRIAMKRDGCTVPQSYVSAKPHNVIHGEFAKRGQSDWAVLCSKDGKSEIRIFWGGETRCQDRLALQEDSLRTRTMGRNQLVYSRLLGIKAPKNIEAQQESWGITLSFIPAHDGIDDAFAGLASVVWFCNNSEWVRLQGAD